jgi:hypothetical protein
MPSVWTRVALGVGVIAGSLSTLTQPQPRLARASDLDPGVRFKSVAVQGNPLGIVIGRYSADLEYLPEPHHALHMTPFAYYALPGVSDQLTGFGAEIGYRWYSGPDGPQGFFLGASFIAGELEYLHTTNTPSAFDPADDTQFVELGGAIDAGFQLIALGNFALGVGAGAQYVVDTVRPRFEFPNHPWHDFLYGWGLRPRALLSVGAAF